jgi:N,N'-diacetyllegionaminate synthase
MGEKMTVKIIAELCQNHNGDPNLLWELLEESKNNGATHAKIQNLYSFELTKRTEFENPTSGKFAMNRPFDQEFERLKKLDLSAGNETEFVARCREIDLVPMTTVFTPFGVQRANDAGFRDIKIPSYGCTDIDLILAADQFAENIVISTGATTMLELECVMNRLREKIRNASITLLHCRTEYPNQLSTVQMSRMMWLKRRFQVSVGFSDHSARVNDAGEIIEHRLLPIKVAMLLGGEVVEKHFTILEYDESKDGRISANIGDLREISRFSSLSAKAMFEELKPNTKLVDAIIQAENNNFDPTVEEWYNRRYYKGRVETLT